ncbi:hypothetical protein OXX80_004197 [Metschnikowia pulcherrima]
MAIYLFTRSTKITMFRPHFRIRKMPYLLIKPLASDQPGLWFYGKIPQIPQIQLFSTYMPFANKIPNTTYEQIPEHLKIHMFTPELEILRHDELRAPFKTFSSKFILQLLEHRSNEVRLESGNSNPASRLNNGNVVRFMKLMSRLKQLFAINGDNTEVLDAVLHSQTTLSAFEAKLAAKKAAREEKATSKSRESDLGTKETYLQTPDSSELRGFAEELRILRDFELKENFGSISARELLNVLETRLESVLIKDSDAPPNPGISKGNLAKFYGLFSRLKRILAVNGGNTSFLDKLLDSQNSHEVVDKTIIATQADTLQASKSGLEDDAIPYRQVPDDMRFEEYIVELKELRYDLGKPFAAVTATDVLHAATKLSERQTDSERGVIFMKLCRNLAMLFKHNGAETSVLDHIILNSDAFAKLESRLQPQKDKTEEAQGLQSNTKYRGADHVIALLNSQSGFENLRNRSLGEDELSIQSALAQAMSKEEKSVCEQDPAEYEAIASLTPDQIRSNYGPKPEKDGHRKVGKKEIESYLKRSKEKKRMADENKWREQTAFEWSNSLYKDCRSFESRNFFNPILGNAKSARFPMFPGTGEEHEYLILSSNGQKFVSQKNPLGLNHVPEDMFAILQTLSEDDLAKFSKNVEKLRRKGWRLIGSGRTKGMLVLSRDVKRGRSRVKTLIKFLLASSGLFFIILLLLNWVIDDKMVEESADISEIAEIESEAESSDVSEEGTLLDDEGKRADVANLNAKESPRKGFFWS